MIPEVPLIGRVVAERFRIVSVLGEGAMATVYRGVQEAEPREVAVKIMHPHLATDPTFGRRFRREAKAAARLRHPNTVAIVDYGVDEGLAFIVMELLTGRDLFDLLTRERRLTGERAARIMLQVCDALAAAHEHGIVHRDLKPENVMLVRTAQRPDVEHVKVLDFGIAKIVERPTRYVEDAPTSVTGSGLTNVGAVLGTPEYMSPEQCQGGILDFRTDIYSLGVLLYQLVTGQVPFSGESPVHTMLKHVREVPAPPRTLAPDLHPAMEAVILRALAKSPGERQQTTLELWEGLADALHQIDPGAHIEPPKRGEFAMSGAFPSAASVPPPPPPQPQPQAGPTPSERSAGIADAPTLPLPSDPPPPQQQQHRPQPAPTAFEPRTQQYTLPMPPQLASAPPPPYASQPPAPHPYSAAPASPAPQTVGEPAPPTLAFYAVTFAVAFLVVLIVLLLIVFR